MVCLSWEAQLLITVVATTNHFSMSKKTGKHLPPLDHSENLSSLFTENVQP